MLCWSCLGLNCLSVHATLLKIPVMLFSVHDVLAQHSSCVLGHTDTTGTSVISSQPSMFVPMEKLSRETSNPRCFTAQPFQPLVSSSWPCSTPPFQPMMTNSWPPIYQFASPHLVDNGLLPIALPFQPMVSSGQLRVSQLALPKGESSQSYSAARQQPFSRP